MSPLLPLIPVLDIRHGTVVHAQAGQRHTYRPWRSPLVGRTPIETAQRLCQAAGSSRFYVADLDALMGEGASDAVTQLIQEATADEILLDRGREIDPILPERVRPIFPLEAGWNIQEHADLLAKFGHRRPVFSLDLYQGQMLFGYQQWSVMDPQAVHLLASLAYSVGYRAFLIVDLAQVGTGRGVESIATAVREMRRCWPETEIIAGGGIRDLRDCQILLTAGANALLTATALHHGWLGRTLLGTSTDRV